MLTTRLQWQRRQKQRTDPSFLVGSYSTTKRLQIPEIGILNNTTPSLINWKQFLSIPFNRIYLKSNRWLLSHIACWVARWIASLAPFQSFFFNVHSCGVYGPSQSVPIQYFLKRTTKKNPPDHWPASLQVDLFRHILHKIFWVPVLKLFFFWYVTFQFWRRRKKLICCVQSHI